MSNLIPCCCPCHVKPERDMHVMSTGSVLWCCRTPYAQPPPMVEPPPLIKNELVEVKPMDMPVSLLFDLDPKYGDKK